MPTMSPHSRRPHSFPLPLSPSLPLPHLVLLLLLLPLLPPAPSAAAISRPMNFMSLDPGPSLSLPPRNVTLPLGLLLGAPCESTAYVTRYLGVPYAEAALGRHRFRPPRVYGQKYPEEGLLAIAPPPPCGDICLAWTEDSSTASEDCLFLNIWVPHHVVTSPTLLPVRVYIHGGMVASCSASDPITDGCSAVYKTATIQVNIQYRKGAMGLLAHPGTWQESNTTGNWAILDQQLAMRWVKEHIQYFGGDPERILLNGNSAGAQAVDFHMVAPGSAGLFSAAISQSPPCVQLTSLDQAYAVTRDFMLRIGCPLATSDQELACLRGAPWATLVSVAVLIEKERQREITMCDKPDWEPFFHYVQDGNTFPYQIKDALMAGNYHNVPYMVGLTALEGSRMVKQMYLDNGIKVTRATSMALMQEFYPAVDVAPLVDTYEGLNFTGPYDDLTMLSTVWTDMFFTCPIYERLVARSKSPFANKTSTYLYHWAATPSCPREDIYLGASHSVDLYFTFGITRNIETTAGLCNLTKAEEKLSFVALTAWSTMAADGVPRWASGEPWPTWHPLGQAGAALQIDDFGPARLAFGNRCRVLAAARAAATQLRASNVTPAAAARS